MAKKSKERFFTTYKFSKGDNIKFILLLREGVSPYKIWMSGISDLNMEDITDADQAQTRRVFKDSEIKTLVKYHDFYVQTCVLQCRNLIALVFLLHHNEHGKQFLKRPR